jgi:mono/diheme cytochrome c family protein
METLTRWFFVAAKQHGVPPVRLRWLVMPVFLLVAGLPTASANNALVERGRYIFTAAGCASCHTHDEVLAGGRPLETPFGIFYPPNITPDREQGIGDWSEADFMRALQEGVNPQGEHYYPAFPYTSYTRMTRADMRALYAYLMTLQPVVRASRTHDLPWFLSSRKLLGLWKAGRFTPGRYQYAPERPGIVVPTLRRRWVTAGSATRHVACLAARAVTASWLEHAVVPRAKRYPISRRTGKPVSGTGVPRSSAPSWHQAGCLMVLIPGR